MYNLTIEKIKNEADVYNIPRAKIATIDFINSIIHKNNVKSILEIGTGNGFSSACFSQNKNIKNILTFEIDLERIKLAKLNLKYFPKVKMIEQDFLKWNGSEKFDLIFIDGMKRLYKDFFLHSQKFSKRTTIFISDNLNFLNNRSINDFENKYKNIIEKLREYVVFLDTENNFQTEFFFEIGDGIAITKKKQIR